MYIHILSVSLTIVLDNQVHIIQIFLLEEKIRKLAIEFSRVYIITGPIMGDNRNGKVGSSNIYVPDKFFKAILVPYKGSYVTIGFIMDNADTTLGKLKEFALSVDELEKQIDLDLFTNLDIITENRIEKQLPLKQLGLY